jgi:ribose transport system permease protein
MKGTDIRAVFGRAVHAQESGLAIALIVICVVLSVINPDFVTQGNLFILSRQVSLALIIAIGMTFVILTAGIDLSVGSVVALSSVAVGYAAVNLNLPIPLVILAGLAVGLVVGMANGVLTVRTGVPSFIVTLGMLGLVRGTGLGLTEGATKSGFDSGFIELGQGSVASIPYPVIVVAVLAVVAHFVLSRTTLGRHIYFVGSNEEAARLSGIHVGRVKVAVFVICSMCASLEAVIETSRLSAAQPAAGNGYELAAIGAVIIGGASLFGGSGRVLGTVLGAILLGVLTNGLVLIGVSAFWQQAVIGVVIIVAVTLNTLKQRVAT